DHRGVLWIGTSSGLLSYRDAEFTRMSGPAGPAAPRISRMVEDRAGRLWGWEPYDSYFYQVQQGRLVPPDPASGLPPRVTAAAADSDGGLWVAPLDRSLVRVHDGHAVRVLGPGALPSPATELYVARNGTLWVGTQHGFGRLAQGAFEFHPL